MNFEEFQSRARFYVVGALEADEMREVEEAAKMFGQRAEDFMLECCARRDAFALSLRRARSFSAVKERLMSMVREVPGQKLSQSA